MHSLINVFIAELMGTYLLMTFGLSGSATNVLGNYDTLLIPAFSYAAGALIGIFFAGPITGGHLNPAASLAFAIIKKCSWRSVPVMMLAQYLGSLLASATIYGIYHESIIAQDPQLTQQTAAIFITFPAKNISLFPAISDQIVSTAILIFGVLMIGNENCFRFDLPFQIITVSSVIFCMIMAFNYNANAILNPARDLSPRIFLWLFGYKNLPFSSLSGNFWWAVGIIGPHLGAILGAVLYEYLRKIRKEHHENNCVIELNNNNNKQTFSGNLDLNNNLDFN